MILIILKLLVVLFFLIMFIRRRSMAWGIGLLTVTTAALLDTFLGTFNREEMLAELGFFFYVISGVLLAGGALWLWGVVRPGLSNDEMRANAGSAATASAGVQHAQASAPAPAPAAAGPMDLPSGPQKLPPALPDDHVDQFAEAGYDRQMLFEEIHLRFSHADLQDLMFDLDIEESDVVSKGQDMDDLIVRIMDEADLRGKVSMVALAVERILTPPPAHNLPRLEKLSPDSPRTVLRHYLLANYDMEELHDLSDTLGTRWEQLEGNDMKAKVRNLLRELYHQDRIADLLAAMATGETDSAAA